MAILKLSFAKHKLIVTRAKLWSFVIFLAFILIADLSRLAKIKFNKLPHLDLIQFFILFLLLTVFVLIEAWVFKKINSKIDKWKYDIDIAKKGNEGEKGVFQELKKFLFSDQYYVFRNVILPGRISDIDFIIIGPKGVIILDVKNYFTHTVFTADNSRYKDKFGLLHFWKKDIRKSVKWQADGLEEFLFTNGISISPRKALVFVSPESVELQDYRNPFRVYVVRGVNELKKSIDGLFPDVKFTPKFCMDVCSVLEKLKPYEKLNTQKSSSISFV